MTLIDFIKEFPDEESCKVKFKAYPRPYWSCMPQMRLP